MKKPNYFNAEGISIRDQYYALDRLTRSLVDNTYHYFDDEQTRRYARMPIVESLGYVMGISYRVRSAVIESEPIAPRYYPHIKSPMLWDRLRSRQAIMEIPF